MQVRYFDVWSFTEQVGAFLNCHFQGLLCRKTMYSTLKSPYTGETSFDVDLCVLPVNGWL